MPTKTRERHYCIAVTSVGGTLALFNGLSVISALELCFWLFRMLMDAVKPSPKSKGEAGTETCVVLLNAWKGSNFPFQLYLGFPPTSLQNSLNRSQLPCSYWDAFLYLKLVIFATCGHLSEAKSLGEKSIFFRHDESQKTSWQSIQRFGVNYCRSTSLHGFAYLVSSRNLPEKLFWAVVILVGNGLALDITLRAFR